MKILIVDDSKLLQMRLLKSISGLDQGIEIFQAYNCNEAANLFSSAVPDTIVLDIELPDGSGIDLLRKFKHSDPSVAVIVFTNYAAGEFRKSCIEMGAIDFIEKSDLFCLLTTLVLLKSKYNNS